jgi:ATP-dependent DNA ligase
VVLSIEGIDMKTYYPPKPLLISTDQPLFAKLEQRADVVAEPKYNGTRLILKRIVDDAIHTGVWLKPYYEFWNRDGEILKYQPSTELLKQLDMIKWEGDCVLDGELLHFKTKKIKHCVIIFDVYLWNGLQTLNWAFEDRRKLLEDKILIPDDCIANPINGFFKNNTVRLAPQVLGGRKDHFRYFYEILIKFEEIEGLVMKSLTAKVVLGRRESPTVAYMWKVRKPGPTYRF